MTRPPKTQRPAGRVKTDQSGGSRLNSNGGSRLSLYDGLAFCGSIAPTADGFEAFDQDGNLLGSFRSRSAALAAIAADNASRENLALTPNYFRQNVARRRLDE